MVGIGWGVSGVGIITTGGSSIKRSSLPANELAEKNPDMAITTVNFKKDKRFFKT
jgi:hypothetical protein